MTTNLPEPHSRSDSDRVNCIADKYIGRDGGEPQVDKPEVDKAAEYARLAALPITIKRGTA